MLGVVVMVSDMSSFGPAASSPPPVNANDPIHRQEAVERLAHARRHIIALASDLDTWWSSNEPRVFNRVTADGLTVETILESSAEPPVDSWRLRAHDVVHALRTALDAFTRSLARAAATSNGKSKVAFPAIADEEKWAGWNGNEVFQADLPNRFRDVQVFRSGRVPLGMINRLDNLEKHEFDVLSAVDLDELHLLDSFTIEGILTEEEFQAAKSYRFPLLDENGEGLIQLHQGEQVILERTVGAKIVDEPVIEGGHSRFTPMIAFDNECEPLIPALQTMGAEAEWAIAYISGVYPSSTVPPTGHTLLI